MVSDDITQAVLASKDVARYLDNDQSGGEFDVRRRVETYLGELRTKQRYRLLYHGLKHPLYPILRKVKRFGERVEQALQATRDGHVVYVSSHKSHLDYLVEPLVLDDAGVRPPLITAGINMFGGPLGLLHRHVTGAIPLRRNSKDPIYLATLRAYVAEILKRRDIIYYAEGGRSYTGALGSLKTGLLQAALLADRRRLSVLPTAIAYDLVLEAPIIARQATKRRIRPFSQELTEMVRQAVGYRTRAFVTFGRPIPLAEYDPASRRDLVSLVHRIQDEIGLLYKVLPTALVGAAIRPQISLAELADRIDALLETLKATGANLAVTNGAAAVEQGVEPLVERGILVADRNVLRVRDRIVLRYYARTLEHLLAPRRRAVH
jgi:1-acyl-sn-glycerol-3-phosphate acyltransferase